MTDDLRDDIIWKQGMRMPWLDTRLGHLKKKVYILYMCYISYILYRVTAGEEDEENEDEEENEDGIFQSSFIC